MTYETLKSTLKPFKAVLIMDDIISHRKRIVLRDVFASLSLVLIVILVLFHPTEFNFKIRGTLIIFLAF